MAFLDNADAFLNLDNTYTDGKELNNQSAFYPSPELDQILDDFYSKSLTQTQWLSDSSLSSEYLWSPETDTTSIHDSMSPLVPYDDSFLPFDPTKPVADGPVFPLADLGNMALYPLDQNTPSIFDDNTVHARAFDDALTKALKQSETAGVECSGTMSPAGLDGDFDTGYNLSKFFASLLEDHPHEHSSDAYDLSTLSPSIKGEFGENPYPSPRKRRSSAVYQCTIASCDKKFTRKFNLQTHLKTHNPCRARLFKCHDCPKDFLRAHDLERHALVHDAIKPYGCPDPDCDKRFTRSDALRRHLKTSRCGGDQDSQM